MPDKPVQKKLIFEELYLQLIEEIADDDEILIAPEQATIIISEQFVFEVKFKKKKSFLKLVKGAEELICLLFLLWGVEHLFNGTLEEMKFFFA